MALADPPVNDYTIELVEGVQANRPRIDEILSDYAEGWTVARMPDVDRLLRAVEHELRLLRRKIASGATFLQSQMVFDLERLSAGRAAWESFVAALTGPWSVLALLVVLAFAVHNSTSWFNVTPKAMPVQIGEDFLPGRYIVAAHYAAWLIASGLILYLALGR